MYKRSLRLVSFLLTLVLLVQMLPATAWAEGLTANSSASTSTQPANAEAAIVEEIESGRSEYSKEFKLSNGLHMAAVYAEPVHYQENGQWKDIDNTLKLSGNAYTNTAGIWDVSFPQQMGQNSAVTITKDGYTLSFFMAGQLRSPGNESVMSASASTEAFSIGSEAFSVQASQDAAAQVQQIDLTEEKAAAEHPETVLEKNRARLQYKNIYANTDIVYDLVSNQVKESIVIGAYDASLRGYCYTLNTGTMIPVLTDSGEIHLYDQTQENIIMVMPAPYLLDDAGEYCDDVAVNLSGSDGTYTLTYTLPQAWLADQARQWPVILDPIVKAESTTSNVSDVSIYQAKPFAYNIAVMDVGYRPANGAMRALVKFFTLPELSDTDMIVDATFNLYHDPAEGAATSISVHKVLGPWQESTVNWTNQPAHDPIVEDYVYASAAGGDFYWDVTEIVRDWYKNGNNGLMLRSPDAVEATTGSRSYRHQFYAENYSRYHIPALSISYRSSIGIEPYYTYATLGVGNAGGVYLSDSTGQITAVKEVASYASTVNPFSASLIYNSVYFAKNESAFYSPTEALGLTMSFGAGWTLDAIQKIEAETISDTAYLKYYDGDGTIHYFQKSSGIYYDEDGLGLEIKVESNGSYTMSDAQDNKWYFTSIGTDYGYFLTSSEDNNGNKYQMNYTSGKLTSIVQQNKNQTAITVATLAYSGNYVSSITDAAGNCYNLTYSGNKLTQAYLGTNQCARYAYSGCRLTTVTDGIRNYSLNFAYSGGKVSSYYEQSGGSTGIRCDITHPSYTQTIYHDYGNDRTKNTSDDLYTHYLMDYAGRTVNAYTTDHTGQNILGASNAVYTDNEGISKTNNRTLRSATIGVAAQKLMLQGNFETTTNAWTYSGAADASTNPRTGKRSLKATLSSAAAAVSASHGTLALTQSNVYTLSAYVNTTGLTSVTGTGVYLKVTESNGTAHTGEAVSYITSGEIDEGWVRISLTFTASASGSATVSIHGTGAVGTFYVDDVQLEKGEAPSNYNMLENSGFQADSTAGGWTLDDTASLCTGVGVNSTDTSAHSIKFQNAIEDKYAIAHQSVNIKESGAQTYVVSGWAKANAVTDNITTRSDPAYDHTKQFGIRATLTYTDGTKNYYYTPFNADVSEWQYASLTVIPESKAKTVDYITVSCVYETNANVAYFDNLSMVREVVNSTEYDTNGNPIQSSTTGLNGQTVSYDSHDNVSRIVTKTGTGSSDKITQTFTYDSTFVHRLLSSTDGTTTKTMTYDSVGNVASTTLKSAKNSTSKVITSSAAYTNSGNQQASTTDSAGSTTTYEYSGALNKVYGIPSKITNAKGTETSYTVDSFGRYQNITVDSNSSLSYIYNSARLHEIQRTAGSKTQTYQFGYDAFDNVTSIGIDANGSDSAITLVEYDYGINNGLLTQQTYANGDSVSFTYDSLGRTKTASYSDGRLLTYTYTGDGQLYSIRDSETGYTYQYTYDTLGRLISSSVKDSGGNILTTQQTYDANNQLTGQSWQIGDTSYSQTFTYNKVTGSLTSMTPGNGHTIRLEYDALQRLNKVDTGSLDRYYTYRDISNTQTTSQVTELRYGTDTETFFTYTYTYDSLGNIATYSDGTDTYTYTYDGKNQLISQTGGPFDFAYTYDSAGNITWVTKSIAATILSYTDPVWTDRLTEIHEAPITYDASGNPTSYCSNKRWKMEWEEGRNLVRIADYDGTRITCAYDQNGLRLSKDVNGVRHEYLYASGTLLREVITGTDNAVQTLDFFYDQSGRPYALNYTAGGTTTTYYYITNLQGDVLHLITADGTVTASYTYNPYGTVLTSTGNMAAVNPLRYRGYYYDSETSFYYLQSRYYDPYIGRFINADDASLLGADGTLLSYNLFAYCSNNPIKKIDKTGNFGLSIGIFIGVSSVIGGLAGAFTAACTGGNVLEGALEGAALGAVAATATIVAPLLLPTASTAATVGATFAIAGAGGMVVDYTTQRVSHELSENSQEEFVLDKGRLIKTGLTTGIAGVVPTYGKPGDSVINAIGSLVMGFDASFINAAAEIAITRFLM